MTAKPTRADTIATIARRLTRRRLVALLNTALVLDHWDRNDARNERDRRHRAETKKVGTR